MSMHHLAAAFIVAVMLVVAPRCDAAQSSDAATLDALRAQLADWANLARYRAANAALPPTAAGERRVVFMGDSITDAWGRQVGTFFPGKPYVNRGISGQTTPQMLVRFMPDVVRLHPAAVVILAGTNDIAGNTGPATPRMIEDNLAAMSAIARQHGIRVVLASILPVATYPWRPDVHPAAEIREINAWIRDYCAREQLVYVDYHGALVGADGGMRAGLSSDGVHPDAAGYALMAPLAEAAIAQALKH